MDGARYTVTMEEFKIFHGIDRALYLILVRDLGRHPVECLYIMGLWLWFERVGFYNFIAKILSLPPILINGLSEEAVACIKSLNIQFPFSSESTEIPLTRSLAKRDISLHFFRENRPTAYHEIQRLVNSVCVPSLSDIMESRLSCFVRNPTVPRVMGLAHAAPTQVQAPSPLDNSSGVGGDSSPSRGRSQGSEMPQNDRTMFVTFSKGYPVTENEVRQFFTRVYGNCIESFHMQEVRPDEQSLYAKIVFLRPAFIPAILNGAIKAKFTINGKHVWMRKFVPKNDAQRQHVPVAY